MTHESPAAEPGDRLDSTRTCVRVIDGNRQGFVEFQLPSGSPELCIAWTLRPSFSGSKDTISTLERMDWYDLARTTNWTPKYVSESELFPAEL